MNPVLFLIDGHAQVYRAFYAVEGLSAPDGRPTGAAFGFTRILLDLLDRHRPDAVIACFDSPGPTFRHGDFADYKANRKPIPPELAAQLPIIMDIVSAYRIPVCALPGYEADDLLGTLTRKAREAGWDVALVSGDKDCGQLLRDGVRIYDPVKEIFIDREAFVQKRGIEPERLTDVMGLWGDAADNIPGVPGIGEKIGVQLISRYGSLENLLEHLDEITGKRGEALRANREQAALSKRLATIRNDAPVELDIEAAKLSAPDTARLRGIFTELGFSSLARRLEESASQPPEECDYRLVDGDDAFEAFVRELEKVDCFAFDTETTGLDPLLAELVGLSFSWNGKSGWYLPFKGPEGAKVLPKSALDRLRAVFGNPDLRKIGHNLKFDALVLSTAGIGLAGAAFDTLIASRLVDGHQIEHNLKLLARKYFNVEMTAIDELIGSGKKQKTMAEIPVETVAEYAAADADFTWRLRETLDRRLDEHGARRVFEEVEMPLSAVLADMQRVGIRIDGDLLAEESRETGRLLEAITSEIHGLAGRDFNIDSPKQLAVVLFEELGLPVVRRTRTGASTDESVLGELADVHNSEIAQRILEYRMYAKLKNTYLEALPKLVNPRTGRLHTSFSQTRTATGRLASSNPNLQNIPVRTERGRAVRAAFIPEDGWKMLAADYSQIELRVLAAFSGDPILRQAFNADMDIHRAVAAEVNGVPPEQVTREQRSAAKAVNFGIIYGQSAHGLAETTGMGRQQAQRFIDDYYARFPGIRIWMDEQLEKARENGYVTTMLGFRRRIPELASSNQAHRARGEREAINTIIQGSAADLIKTAMVKVGRSVRASGLKSRLLLQIHDELLFECPPAEVEKLSGLVREAMEGAVEMATPLKVDIGVGDNWLEAK
ncbi:MAG: DNA polymerase I [Planctomycetota bacterium]|jgi:DNA polymerase-1|nr:DNA polymerase I [Planctomycetota bacterium]